MSNEDTNNNELNFQNSHDEQLMDVNNDSEDQIVEDMDHDEVHLGLEDHDMEEAGNFNHEDQDQRQNPPSRQRSPSIEIIDSELPDEEEVEDDAENDGESEQDDDGHDEEEQQLEYEEDDDDEPKLRSQYYNEHELEYEDDEDGENSSPELIEAQEDESNEQSHLVQGETEYTGIQEDEQQQSEEPQNEKPEEPEIEEPEIDEPEIEEPEIEEPEIEEPELEEPELEEPEIEEPQGEVPQVEEVEEPQDQSHIEDVSEAVPLTVEHHETQLPEVRIANENDVPEIKLPEEIPNTLHNDMHIDQENVNDDHQDDDQQDIEEVEGEEEDKVDEMNTSGFQMPLNNNQFTTPLKSLPPLKDIDQIETPKSFNVAKDNNHVGSSPSMQYNLPLKHSSIQNHVTDATTNDNDIKIAIESETDPMTLISSYLNVPEVEVASLNNNLIDKLLKKSLEYSEIQSEISFLKINQEKISQMSQTKYRSLYTKYEDTIQKLNDTMAEKDSLIELKLQNNLIVENYQNENSHLKHQLNDLKNKLDNLENQNSNNSNQIEMDIINYNNQINSLTKDNIEKNQKINELTKSINDTRNGLFDLKFNLSKSTNESSFYKKEKEWFEKEWKECQERLTELSKSYQSEKLTKANEISELSSKLSSSTKVNESLNKSIKLLELKVENQLTEINSIDSKLETSKINYEKQLKSKDDIIELLKIQTSESSSRIQQLENYIEEVKSKSSNKIDELTTNYNTKLERCVELEEKLKRTEEALEEELRQENDLPKLTPSGELVASKLQGISLSSLYSEFIHIKKQLLLERSQKEKLANQLEVFINELESKKPMILSYKEQIVFYEASMKDMVTKVENIRYEKLESDKKVNRFKSKIIEYEDELVSMKKLCKDLGKQLCYYLIHSRIRENNENPLSLTERNAIDNILERTSNNENSTLIETDTDQLISERLVEFANIIELQQRNTELLTVTRQLGKKLEDQDSQSHNELESVAIEEAKEAILTLEGELDSLKTRYDAVIKERDVLKSISGPSNNKLITATDHGNDNANGDAKYLTEVNNDLRKRISEYEERFKSSQGEFNSKVKHLSEKLDITISDRDELKLKINSMKHQVELIETKYNNLQITLENSNNEVNRLQENSTFWQQQASKQENLLIAKNNELKDIESQLNKEKINNNSLVNQNNLLKVVESNLNNDVNQLKSDKLQLNEFVSNLQSLLKERDTSSIELNERLNQSIKNYQILQEKLNERDEKLSILSNQSELALKSQNTKLEQFNEISHKLMTTRLELDDKSKYVDNLKGKIKELTDKLKESDTRVKAYQINTGEAVPATASDVIPSSNGASDSLEIEQLRTELKQAQSDVSDLENISKSAEDALVNLTNSFDDFKAESNNIQVTLKAEKDALTEQVERLKNELNKLSNELSAKDSEYLNKINELKLQLESSMAKAKSYDSLEVSYEEKLSGIKNELSIYTTLSNENQKKYHEEVSKNDQLTREIVQLKEDNETLKSNISSLQSQLATTQAALDESKDLVISEKSKIEDELQSQHLKTQELENQNNILLNQLELMKPNHTIEGVSDSDYKESDSSNELFELRQVVNFVRREKEAAESKAAMLREEMNRVQLRLNSTLSELESTKSELMNSMNAPINLTNVNQDHDKLVQQLEQMNILKESNTTLRNENQNYIKQIQKFEVQIHTIQNKLTPLESEVKKLNNLISERDQSIRLLNEENKSLLNASTNNNANKVNATESEEYLNLKSRFDGLLEESKTKLASAKARNKANQEVVESLNNEISKLKQQIIDTKSDYESQISKLNDKLANNNSSQVDSKELENLKIQFNIEKEQLIKDYESKLKDALSTNKNNQDWEKKYQELERSINDNKAQLEAEFSKKLEEELSKQKSAISTDNGTENNDYENKINILKQEFSKQLEKEKEDVRAQTEKKFEIKMRMLNKKLDKLNGSNDSTLISTSSNSNSSPAPISTVDTKTPSQEPPKSLGHQFTESTLTVRIPETNGKDKKVPDKKVPDKKVPEKKLFEKKGNDKKRSFTPQPHKSNKKPKE